MIPDELRRQHRELNQRIRAGDLEGAERIAIELSPEMERIYDELDNKGILLSWGCDA